MKIRYLCRSAAMAASATFFLTCQSTTAHACVSREPTPASSPGPHDYSFAPAETALWREGDAGEPLFLRARILDPCGEPVSSAQVQVLHADHNGHHDPQRWRARLTSNERGELALVTVLPGYAGGLPRHIHFIVSHPEYQQLVTRLHFKNDAAFEHGPGVLAIVLEEVQRNEKKVWVGGFEFVLRPQ